jgi:hypothetical protein
MPALNHETCCEPVDIACGALPAAFVRQRFFFGKRMGVSEFFDMQLYPLLKQRFHNQHLHGVGVVCGLGLTQFPGAPLLLRVTKGAALDACGREIVVGWDQCIDVAGWLAAELTQRRQSDPNTQWPGTDLDASSQMKLYVALRYEECATSPEPAPRDPCSCDAGGCELGRIREGFELQLMTAAEAQPYQTAPQFPSEADLDNALAATATGDVTAALGALVRGAFDNDDSDGWIVIGSIVVTVAKPNPAKGTDWTITGYALGPISGPMLLSTAALQELLLRGLPDIAEPAALSPSAPRISDVTLAQDAGDPTKYTLTLALTGAIVAKTLSATGQFDLRRLDTTNGWSASPAKLTAAYQTTPPTIVLTLINTDTPVLLQPGLFRLSLSMDAATPIVDDHMRPLLPVRFAYDFGVVDDGTGKLVIAAKPPFLS